MSQAVTESVLVQRLEQLGGRVLRPYTVTGLDQDAASVTATFTPEPDAGFLQHLAVSVKVSEKAARSPKRRRLTGPAVVVTAVP